MDLYKTVTATTCSLYCFYLYIFRLPEHYCENCGIAVHPDKVRTLSLFDVSFLRQ